MSRGTIFDDLREDHRLVLERIQELERDVFAPKAGRERARAGQGMDRVKGVVALLRRQFATHMAAEDEVLYPALVEALPQTKATIDPLHAEHEELRSMLIRLEKTLSDRPGPVRDEQIAVQVRDLVDLLRIHIRKEETLILGVAERVLDCREIESLGERFRSRSEVETTKGPSPGRITKGTRK